MKQFIKYAIVGGFATAINLIVAGLCAAWLWPCLAEGDPLVRLAGFPWADIADAVRANRAVWCNLVGFVIANIVCWVLNRMFVFEPGRHRWYVEFLLFFGGSAFAIICGSAVIWLAVNFCGAQTSYSFVINVIVSVLLNFVVRKFIVFRR